MQCQNCEKPLHPSDERCQHCGARPLHRRVILGSGPKEFFLTPEDEAIESGDSSKPEPWEANFEQPIEGSRQAEEDTAVVSVPVRWGGFLRRTVAFIIDMIVVLGLAGVMGYLSYVGYKVGLSAHGRAVTWENVTPLIVLLTWGWIGLATGYFVLFHGMEGKTIGKWLLGLRVVGPEQAEITYKQALLRCIGTVGFAPLGLGCLWIIWSREKRGWHDILARTWVIRG